MFSGNEGCYTLGVIRHFKQGHNQLIARAWLTGQAGDLSLALHIHSRLEHYGCSARKQVQATQEPGDPGVTVHVMRPGYSVKSVASPGLMPVLVDYSTDAAATAAVAASAHL